MTLKKVFYLNNRYQSLGDRYKEEFIETIKLQNQYLKDPNTSLELLATTLRLNTFWDWLWNTDEIWQKES